MPDFERLIDQFRVDMARTPEERARAEGFNAGKQKARREIAYMVAFIVGIAAFLAVWSDVLCFIEQPVAMALLDVQFGTQATNLLVLPLT